MDATWRRDRRVASTASGNARFESRRAHEHHRSMPGARDWPDLRAVDRDTAALRCSPMHGGHRTPPLRALVHAWLVLDFFGEARRSGGDASTLTTTIFSQSFLSLGVSALLYPEVPPVPFAAATLSVSTLLVALGAFDTEQPTHRRAADRILLATSPVSRLQAVLARCAHASFSTMLVTIGMALPPAILLACHESDPWKVPFYILLACMCSGLAIAGLSVTLRAARALLGGHGAALVAGTGKALLLGFGVVWVVRYLVLDRWIFKVTHHGEEPDEDELEMMHGDVPI